MKGMMHCSIVFLALRSEKRVKASDFETFGDVVVRVSRRLEKKFYFFFRWGQGGVVSELFI